MITKEKAFVNPANNILIHHEKNHITVDSDVIVVDGSYMTDEFGVHVSGISFKNGGLSELLKVTRVNIPFKTYYRPVPHVLGYHNNCEIQGSDGKKYHCSHINIIRFSY